MRMFTLILTLSILIQCLSSVYEYEPYTILKKNKLIGFYTFDDIRKATNISPYFTAAPNSINNGTNFNIISASDSIQGSSYFFDGSAQVSIPISLKVSDTPKISIGGWFKFELASKSIEQNR